MTNHPHEPEAERAVLGAALQDEASLLDAADILQPDDFHSQANRNVFAACISLAAENRPHDIVAVTHALKSAGQLEQSGGYTYVTGLIDTIPDVADVSHYAHIVKDCSIKRALLSLGHKTASAAESHHTTGAEVIELAQAGLMEISTGSERGAEDALTAADRILASFQDRENATDGAQWPLESLFRLTGMLGHGQLVIVAGRPKSGKSALGVQLAHSVAKHGGGVHFASLEMTSDELVKRIQSAEAKVNLSAIMRQVFNSKEHQRLNDCRNRISPTLMIDDRPAQTLIQVRGQARKTQARRGLKLIVVDYLQLMGGRQKGWTREETVSANAYGLKALAKDLQCPVVALAQLNRGVEGEKRAPRMSDLRESGAIEQALDVAVLIDRAQGARTGSLYVYQRNGPAGSCNIGYEGEFVSFYDIEPTREEVGF